MAGGVHGRLACMAGGGGMHDKGVCMARGTWVAGGGVGGREKWPLQRAVRILLECILVHNAIVFIDTSNNA